MGAKVFKLLPAEMLYKNSPDESRRDEDFPLGIRGGGAYYSFSTESHSFNKDPEIALYPPKIASGSTTQLAFTADLGKRDLAFIDVKTEGLEYFLNYTPPKYFTDYPLEYRKFNNSRGMNVSFSIGNTYVLRSITLDKSDILVAFQILKTDANGALTIAWKTLAKFPIPFALYMPDDELQRKVDLVLAEGEIDCDPVIVKDNHIYFNVHPLAHAKSRGNEMLLQLLNRRGIRYKGSGGNLPERRPIL